MTWKINYMYHKIRIKIKTSCIKRKTKNNFCVHLFSLHFTLVNLYNSQIYTIVYLNIFSHSLIFIQVNLEHK